MNNFWWHLHILQYANEQSCKSQIARREKRKEEIEEGGGAEWKREKQTEAGVNYGCNLRFPRGKERQRETLSHAYQIAHLPHFFFFSSWSLSKLVYSLPSSCVCIWKRKWERAFTHSSMSICVELCSAVKCSLNLEWRVCLRLCRISSHCCESWCAITVTWPLMVYT